MARPALAEDPTPTVADPTRSGGLGAAADLGTQALGRRLAIGDWKPPGTTELIRRPREGITPGAVVLMHDGGGDRSQAVDAVHTVVPALRSDRWHLSLPARRG
ncbi:hypothetical protein [Microbispora sp. KK1-11]|uniref:hypothetical protein n=1 Tax=Microbispora sp. KK1-11 TaxID=2053005 RepID=UPI00163CECEF|nr:hypothetical protein [Microbispora sp. KK1-11]